ncbi:MULTISPECIES: CHAP domain-containing protein [Acidiphilium]|nr:MULTISPECIES: CHAP domain-containing protein [Acidiphilium]
MRIGWPMVIVVLGLSGCGTSPPRTGINAYGQRTNLSCVPYARAVSGIALTGNAWTWWHEAAGRYTRSHAPAVGAVLVLRRHGSMDEGHLAVVTHIVASREITVTQANWLPGRIEHGQPVFDVSPRNDWTLVRVWYPPTRALGITEYPADGFILPTAPQNVARLEPTLAAR